MANAWFTYPGENAAVTAVVSANTGTVDVDYPVENVQDLNPARPVKFTTTSGSLVFDLGSAIPLDIVGIVHHNLDTNYTITVQAHTSDAWGAPSLSTTFTVPAWRLNGFPVNPYKDLTGITPRSFRYWRILFSGANSVPIHIGEIWLARTKYSLIQNVRWGLAKLNEQPRIRRETDMLVETVYSYGVSRDSYRGDIATALNDGALEQLEDWWDAAHGSALAFLFAIDGAVNDCMMARFVEETMTRTFETYNHTIVPIQVREVSRGLVL